jgi:hypothetical protein
MILVYFHLIHICLLFSCHDRNVQIVFTLSCEWSDLLFILIILKTLAFRKLNHFYLILDMYVSHIPLYLLVLIIICALFLSLLFILLLIISFLKMILIYLIIVLILILFLFHIRFLSF